MNARSARLGLAVLLSSPALALAQQHVHFRVPPEALEACAGREQEASCEFQLDGHSISGSCRPSPAGSGNVCVPDHGAVFPPPEALVACSGQSEGTSCQFTLEGQPVAGLCRAGPRGEPVACAPSDPPHPPR